MMSILFGGRVAVVTGAAQGLGRAHALGLSARGAKVVVMDVGPPGNPAGIPSAAAQAVAQEIREAGGEAIAEGVDVTQPAQVNDAVARTVSRWGRIDVLVNNAGILRDKTFAKIDLENFRLVLEVHLMGAVHCCKAVLPIMREQGYGRVVLTSSASGIFGNFGQANYGAAKASLVGLMNVLDLEYRKYGVKVNILAPTAATEMTAALFDTESALRLTPETVTPGLLFLVSEEAPSRVILSAGAGVFSRIHILETRGVYLAEGSRTPEALAEQFQTLSELDGAETLSDALAQTRKFVQRAMAEEPNPPAKAVG
jgi:NAD(P)-dependent dehydrogenase (short-subunit alcohol dehydrogenase family)